MNDSGVGGLPDVTPRELWGGLWQISMDLFLLCSGPVIDVFCFVCVKEQISLDGKGLLEIFFSL